MLICICKENITNIHTYNIIHYYYYYYYYYYCHVAALLHGDQQGRVQSCRRKLPLSLVPRRQRSQKSTGPGIQGCVGIPQILR